MSSDQGKTSASQLSFEEAFTKLRETVEALEAGELPLEESTRLYEKGMQLAKTCNEALSKAEIKITRLQQGYAAQADQRAAEEDESSIPEVSEKELNE